MPVVDAPTARALSTFQVARGDVELYSNLSAFIVPAREERLSFMLDGHTITGIFVDVGDDVKEGDVIAILDLPAIENELRNAHVELDWLELDLDHARRRHARARAVSRTAAASYLSEVTYLEQQLEIHKRQIEYLTYRNAERYLVAPIGGTVTSVITFHEGMTSNTQQTVAVVSDQTQSVFVVRGTEWFNVVTGDRFIIGINQEPFTGEVVDPAEFGIIRHGELSSDIYLVLHDDDGISEMTGTVHGTVRVERDVARDVLFIPLTALNRTSTRTFVYVITDDVRTVRDVEIGLWGNNALEIVNGLAEGEMVVNE